MTFQIKNDFLEATFDTFGAELISLKSNHREYIWNMNLEFWNRRSPILFPIIGSLKDDTYYFEGKEYQLPRHGFAREKQFKVVEKSTDKIVFSLKEDAKTLKAYPFHFELQIEYQLIDQRLEVHYKVENTSKKKMYFSIGGHPGFALSENFKNYSLIFETDAELNFSLLENHLLADENQVLDVENKRLTLNYQLFEKDALVFKNQEIQSVILQENGIDLLKVEFQKFPDLGIWTKVGAPFICIEPWFGHADEVNTNQKLEEKAGIQMLNVADLFESFYTIQIF